ncbi:NUDIX hydrolase [Fusibacter ferrireducens]|uniref:NUDIX domain-containing protein n=1 Tax=Fusibacter ferrireducens TaxID=2785058 RepID=A0ABR9ZUT6_9FIRM|nr:NUDIX domain-containing protein [Fusibacter ferrireducens]MBF4693645.1 NUDIX domain-containing protein [Fusibacter ferrireducens]
MEIKFKNCEQVTSHLKYVVIVSRYEGQWLLVKHRERTTWEIPGGHIEPGETPDEAARRELIEESTADQFTLVPISDYSVTRAGEVGYGRLYYAEIRHLKLNFDYEIERCQGFDVLPEALTYPEIQPHLLAYVKKHINNQK